MTKVLSLEAVTARRDVESSGKWMPYEYGGEFLVAYHRNVDYHRRKELFLEEERKALGLSEGEPIPVDARNRATVKAMFGTILRDWRGVCADAEGTKPLEFTLDNVLAIMLVDIDLGQRIHTFAETRENFHRAEREARVRD